jgi:hypothetical protein
MQSKILILLRAIELREGGSHGRVGARFSNTEQGRLAENKGTGRDQGCREAPKSLTRTGEDCIQGAHSDKLDERCLISIFIFAMMLAQNGVEKRQLKATAFKSTCLKELAGDVTRYTQNLVRR